MNKIKELRDRTSVGFLACKKALEESAGDMEKAIAILKKLGLANAVKRAGREASEGSITVLSNGKSHGMLFLGSETDFVAKNDEFCHFAKSVLNDFLKSEVKNIAEFKRDIDDINGLLAEIGSKIGENITVRGSYKIEETPGTKVFTYVHNKVNEKFPEVATIGVILKIKGECSDELGKQLCMHLASFKPTVLTRQQLSKEWQEEQKQEAEENLESRIKEAVFEEQAFLMDSSTTIKDLLKKHNLEVEEFKVFSVK